MRLFPTTNSTHELRVVETARLGLERRTKPFVPIHRPKRPTPRRCTRLSGARNFHSLPDLAPDRTVGIKDTTAGRPILGVSYLQIHGPVVRRNQVVDKLRRMMLVLKVMRSEVPLLQSFAVATLVRLPYQSIQHRHGRDFTRRDVPERRAALREQKAKTSTEAGSILAQVGSERSSTTRRLEWGQVCYRCGVELDPLPAWTRGERACANCASCPHRVLMNFMLRESWSIHFIAEDCRTPIGGYFKLKDLDVLRDLVRRGNCENVDEFDQCVRHWGRGSVYLQLTEQQYRQLTRRRHSRNSAQL